MKVQVKKSLTIPLTDILDRLKLPIDSLVFHDPGVKRTRVTNPVNSEVEFHAPLTNGIPKTARKIAGLGRWFFFRKVKMTFLGRDLRTYRVGPFEVGAVRLDWEESKKPPLSI